MHFSRFFVPMCAFLATTQLAATAEVSAPVYAVPTLQIPGGALAPIDIQSASVVFEFDVASGRATGRASITFTMLDNGFPMFDLVPSATSIVLDNQGLALDHMALQDAPEKVTSFRYLKSSLQKGTQHTASFTYNLSSEYLDFASNSVSFGTFMSDLGTGGRQFWEQFSPSNFEFDQFTQHVSVRVTGTTEPHALYTNAITTEAGANEWNLGFRDTSTTSSFYLHLAPTSKFVAQKFDYAGIEAAIPVTVYAKSDSLLKSGAAQIKKSLEMLESTYGAYTHPALLVYVTGHSFDGGMEYAGATATDVDAINHELTHMWFARGVMPASGNAGWVDEALATWTDEGFQRSSIQNRSPVNMSGWSVYRRDTDTKAYSKGAQFISELDGFFKETGGMRPILRKFFAERKLSVIETSDFIRSIESQTNQSVQKYFDRYAYGKDVQVTVPNAVGADEEGAAKAPKTPRIIHKPFSKQRLKEIL